MVKGHPPNCKCSKCEPNNAASASPVTFTVLVRDQDQPSTSPPVTVHNAHTRNANCTCEHCVATREAMCQTAHGRSHRRQNELDMARRDPSLGRRSTSPERGPKSTSPPRQRRQTPEGNAPTSSDQPRSSICGDCQRMMMSPSGNARTKRLSQVASHPSGCQCAHCCAQRVGLSPVPMPKLVHSPKCRCWMCIKAAQERQRSPMDERSRRGSCLCPPQPIPNPPPHPPSSPVPRLALPEPEMQITLNFPKTSLIEVFPPPQPQNLPSSPLAPPPPPIQLPKPPQELPTSPTAPPPPPIPKPPEKLPSLPSQPPPPPIPQPPQNLPSSPAAPPPPPIPPPPQNIPSTPSAPPAPPIPQPPQNIPSTPSAPPAPPIPQPPQKLPATPLARPPAPPLPERSPTVFAYHSQESPNQVVVNIAPPSGPGEQPPQTPKTASVIIHVSAKPSRTSVSEETMRTLAKLPPPPSEDAESPPSPPPPEETPQENRLAVVTTPKQVVLSEKDPQEASAMLGAGSSYGAVGKDDFDCECASCCEAPEGAQRLRRKKLRQLHLNDPHSDTSSSDEEPVMLFNPTVEQPIIRTIDNTPHSIWIYGVVITALILISVLYKFGML